MNTDRAIAADVVRRYRVPPNMRVELIGSPTSPHPHAWAVRVEHRAPDVTDQTIPVRDRRLVTTASVILDHQVAGLPPEVLAGTLRHLIERAVRQLWDHELREWLTFDGDHVDPPHGPDGAFR